MKSSGQAVGGLPHWHRGLLESGAPFWWRATDGGEPESRLKEPTQSREAGARTQAEVNAQLVGRLAALERVVAGLSQSSLCEDQIPTSENRRVPPVPAPAPSPGHAELPLVVQRLRDDDDNVRCKTLEELQKLEPAVLASHVAAIVERLGDDGTEREAFEVRDPGRAGLEKRVV